MLKGSGHQFDDLGGTGTTYSNCDKLFLVGQDGITQVQVNDKVFLDKHPVLFMNVLFMIWNTSDYYYTARQTPVYVGENCSIIPHDQNIPGIHVANGNTSFDLLRASYFSCPIRVEDGVNIQIRMYQRALMDTPCVYSIGSTLNSLLEIVRDASTVAPVQALNFDGQISDVLIDASDSTYFNNAITGLLTAVNVQGAIDELTNLTGAGVSVTNELVINNNETEIVGKQYQSIANADSYVQTQPTSVFNRFVTRFS